MVKKVNWSDEATEYYLNQLDFYLAKGTKTKEAFEKAKQDAEEWFKERKNEWYNG